MKKAIVVQLMLMFALLVGCAAVRDMPPSLDTTFSKNTTYVYDDPKDEKFFRTVYSKGTDDNMKQMIRNRIIFELIEKIDIEYGDYTKNVRYQRQFKDIVLDLLGLGFSSAGSFVGGPTVKSILSGVSTGFQGVNTAIDRDIFAQETWQAVVNQMSADRSAVQSTILTNMAKKDADYPLEAAMEDLVHYIYAGTFTHALASIVANTGQSAQDNKNTVNDQKASLKLSQ